MLANSVNVPLRLGQELIRVLQHGHQFRSEAGFIGVRFHPGSAVMIRYTCWCVLQTEDRVRLIVMMVSC